MYHHDRAPRLLAFVLIVHPSGTEKLAAAVAEGSAAAELQLHVVAGQLRRVCDAHDEVEYAACRRPVVRNSTGTLIGLAIDVETGAGEISFFCRGCVGRRDLHQCSLTWAEVFAPPPPPIHEPLFRTWRATCAELAKRPHDLRPWERRFVANLPGFVRISTKQRYVLEEIAERMLGSNPT